jgi:nucleotide-binding universal stress UspA family protein
VWRLVHSLEPPVLVTPPGGDSLSNALFCTGGERFIEDGARFAARLLAAAGASVTVLHVLPWIPGMYGDRIREEEADVEEFLATNSRTSRSVLRQVEIFRAAGVAATLRLATGDVAPRILEEVRRGGHDLLLVGSSPARGRLRTYMLGDLSRDIVGRSGIAFLVLRSKPPGFLTQMWRSLREGITEGSAE